MENRNGSLNLGVIICIHCSEIIDTVDTNKVVRYYGVCDKESCKTDIVHEQENHEFGSSGGFIHR